MGRHATSEGKNTTRQGALLGWGLFVAVLVVICSPMVGLDLLAAAVVGLTAAVVFVALYFLSGVPQ
ncbi:hypothetical protein GCM10009596_11510 [Arthrobacter rhombi]|uniref:hypothetical protein n=1 Tax=Arthrobacter rhombi TaxID=71253 RepID=UPI0031D898C0